MSIKNSQEMKRRWALVSAEKRRERARLTVKARWDRMSKEDRRKYAIDKLVAGRKNKIKKPS